MTDSAYPFNIDRRSIVTLFIIFIGTAILLFVAMAFIVFIPRIDNVFDELYGESDEIAARVFADQLEQYIYDRELALGDIAANPIITNTVLLADYNNSAFLDYIDSTNILGENSEMVVIDAIGGVFYKEVKDSNDYQWLMPLLESGSLKKSVIKLVNYPDGPRFELAVPILYGEKPEGVLLARITADPARLFKSNAKINQNYSVAYEKNFSKIVSDTSGIRSPHEQKVNISRYDIVFSFISDHTIASERKTELIDSFILTILFATFAILIVLFFLGRKIILSPFEALSASQQSIAYAMEGISHIDTKGHYVNVNQAYASNTGYSIDELTGQHWSVTTFNEDIQPLEDACNDMLSLGKVSLEARCVKKDGTLLYQRVTMVPHYDKKGVLTGHDRFMQDITSIKKRDEKIHQQQQDLQLIFDSVPVKIWYKDDKNKILRLNKQAAESMGGSVDDFEGKNAYDLFPEMAKQYHDDDLAVIESNAPLLNIVEEYTPLNGPRAWVSTNKIPYTNPETGQSFVFVCAQDITELKQIEVEKNRLIDELSHTNKELEQFAYIASHDLKAPLRGIEQLAEWIMLDCSDILPEKSQNHLLLMVNRVKRMARLLEDLLSYSHVSRMDNSQEYVDLKLVVSELLDLHVEPFGFTHTLNLPEAKVKIARKPFEIIIRNLLDNAVKHHHKGRGHITISYDSRSSCHLITVQDDGPGIKPHLHDKAFTMFQTLQSRDKVEGSGMGLAIIKKILKRYDGDINIVNAEGAGAIFNIKWPCNDSNIGENK